MLAGSVAIGCAQVESKLASQTKQNLEAQGIDPSTATDEQWQQATPGHDIEESLKSSLPMGGIYIALWQAAKAILLDRGRKNLMTVLSPGSSWSDTGKAALAIALDTHSPRAKEEANGERAYS